MILCSVRAMRGSLIESGEHSAEPMIVAGPPRQRVTVGVVITLTAQVGGIYQSGPFGVELGHKSVGGTTEE